MTQINGSFTNNYLFNKSVKSLTLLNPKVVEPHQERQEMEEIGHNICTKHVCTLVQCWNPCNSLCWSNSSSRDYDAIITSVWRRFGGRCCAVWSHGYRKDGAQILCSSCPCWCCACWCCACVVVVRSIPCWCWNNGVDIHCLWLRCLRHYKWKYTYVMYKTDWSINNCWHRRKERRKDTEWLQ